MDRILAQLTSQRAYSKEFPDPREQNDDQKASSQPEIDHGSSSNSLPITPANETFSATGLTTRPASASLNDGQAGSEDEVLRLKMQLAQAQNHISKLDQELSATRSVHNDSDNEGYAPPKIQGLASHDSVWAAPSEGLPETVGTAGNSSFGNTRSVWQRSSSPYSIGAGRYQAPEANSNGFYGAGRGSNQLHGEVEGSYPTFEGFRRGRNSPEFDHFLRGHGGGRRNLRAGIRPNANDPFSNTLAGYSGNLPQYGSVAGPSHFGTIGGPNVNQGIAQLSPGMYPQFSQQSIPTSLSPHASEFMSKGVHKTEVS